MGIITHPPPELSFPLRGDCFGHKNESSWLVVPATGFGFWWWLSLAVPDIVSAFTISGPVSVNDAIIASYDVAMMQRLTEASRTAMNLRKRLLNGSYKKMLICKSGEIAKELHGCSPRQDCVEECTNRERLAQPH